jgi:curli biogenesis system outer membrane secretion channel CsgG
MKGLMAVAVAGLLVASVEKASGQFGFNSKRETYSVPVAHPPELVLPNVKRIAISGFTGGFPCGQEVKDRLSETITRSGTFELIDRTSLSSVLAEQDLQASAFADRANAIKLGKLLGPAAIVAGTVTRCSADHSPMMSQRGYKDKKGRVSTIYSRETTAHVSLSVQVIDVATSKVVLFRTITSDPVEKRQATDQYPEVVDARALLARAIGEAEQDVEHLLFGWRESVSVTVHADKECELKPAAAQIRGGDFTGAADAMQKAIDRQCDAPNDRVALAKAYHNRGVALTYAGRPDEGLSSLQQANRLWPGNVSEEAMAAARKLIQAGSLQQTQDATAAEAGKAAAAVAQTAEASLLSNKDVIEMAQAKLSDQIIISKVRTTKCKFDTSPSALIQLKRSGASDAVVLALTEAQCAK